MATRERSVFREILHREVQVVGLWEDCVFQDGLVGDERVFCSDSTYGRIELIEQLIGYPCGNFGAVAPT